MLNFNQLIRSFRFAIKGVVYVFKTEQNFRIQLIIAALVAGFSWLFQITVAQAIILILLITLVLVLELINTIFEKIVDLLKPRLHLYVEVIKDMMSAAVLLSSLGASIIGLMIFIPYFIALFTNL